MPQSPCHRAREVPCQQCFPHWWSTAARFWTIQHRLAVPFTPVRKSAFGQKHESLYQSPNICDFIALKALHIMCDNMQVLPTYSSLIITHHAGCLSVMGCNLVVGRSNFSGNAAHSGQLGQMVVPGGGAVFASSLKSVVIKDSNFNSNTAILGAVSFMYPHAQKTQRAWYATHSIW